MNDINKKDLSKVSGGRYMPHNAPMSDEEYRAGVIKGNCPYCGNYFERYNKDIALWRQGKIGGDMWDPGAPQLYCCNSPECKKKANDEDRKRWGYTRMINKSTF